MIALPARALPQARVAMLGPVFCQEARAAFAAMTVQPSFALKRLYNEAIRSLQRAGHWTKFDALYLMNVETAQAARVNIKAPNTYDLTAVSSPTFTAKVGYAGDGAAAYLSTNFNPTGGSPNFVQNSASIFGWSLNAAAQSAALVASTSSSDPYIFPSDGISRINTTSELASVSPDGAGLFLATRTDGTTQRLYRNGSQLNSAAHASGSPPNTTFSLLRFGGATFFSGGIAMAGIGSGLDATQAADLYTILAAFKSGVEAL